MMKQNEKSHLLSSSSSNWSQDCRSRRNKENRSTTWGERERERDRESCCVATCSSATRPKEKRRRTTHQGGVSKSCTRLDEFSSSKPISPAASQLKGYHDNFLGNREVKPTIGTTERSRRRRRRRCDSAPSQNTREYYKLHCCIDYCRYYYYMYFLPFSPHENLRMCWRCNDARILT